MKASYFAVALSVLAVAGAARAQSFIPGNYVDDFGPVASDTSVAPEPVAKRAYASLMVGGSYVDDFGTVATFETSTAPAVTVPTHSSLIPSNYVDDFGTEPTHAAPDRMLARSGPADPRR
jgi:hypothetical protein